MAVLRLDYVNSFMDAGDKLRHIFRRKGFKRETIKGVPGSAEFMAHYDQLLKKTSPDAEPVERDAPGSIDRVIKQYKASPMFTDELAKATQSNRAAFLKRFQNATTPAGRRFGDNMIATLATEKGRDRIRDELAKLTPNAQMNYLKALRHLVAYAIKNKLLTSNPTEDIEVAKASRSDGHLTWGEIQIQQYRDHHAIGTVPRLALELMLNIAARRHDAHLIGRQHLRNGVLTWKPHKTLRSTGKTLSVGVLPELSVALDAMPKTQSLAFLTTQHGRPFKSSAAFGNAMALWCVAAGLEPVMCKDGRVRSYRAHGLRKAALTALAHAGATGPELLSISGQSSLDQVEPYIADAEQARLAASALAKLPNNRTVKALKKDRQVTKRSRSE